MRGVKFFDSRKAPSEKRDDWRDDAQVVRIHIEKWYSKTPGAPVKVMTADGKAA